MYYNGFVSFVWCPCMAINVSLQHNGVFFVFVWCPCMANNVSVQHNGVFLHNNILFSFLSGVPAWRLIQVYSITVCFSTIIYC